MCQINTDITMKSITFTSIFVFLLLISGNCGQDENVTEQQQAADEEVTTEEIGTTESPLVTTTLAPLRELDFKMNR